jgi:hypothetical protein
MKEKMHKLYLIDKELQEIVLFMRDNELGKSEKFALAIKVACLEITISDLKLLC